MKATRAASASCADLSTAAIGLRAALSRDFLRQLSTLGKERTFAPGDGVAAPLSSETKVICIQNGALKIVSILHDGRQQIVDFLTSGDLLFQSRSDDYGQRVAVAISGVKVLEFGLHELFEVLATHDHLRQEFFRSLIFAVDGKSRHISALGRMRSDERVAYFLLDLSKRSGRSTLKDGALQLPLYRSEIADYLGLTTETVSRVFSALRDRGLIRLATPDQVVIEDANKLTLIASGRASLTVK